MGAENTRNGQRLNESADEKIKQCGELITHSMTSLKTSREALQRIWTRRTNRRRQETLATSDGQRPAAPAPSVNSVYP